MNFSQEEAGYEEEVDEEADKEESAPLTASGR